MSDLIPNWRLRQVFSLRLSRIYRDEVPAYGHLIDITRRVAPPGAHVDDDDVRHGAVRVALPGELSLLRRAFGLLGMHPVGYYDLAAAGLPVHSTAFRPLTASEIGRNPFRLFVSLVRLDQIASPSLLRDAERLMQARSVFSPGMLALIERAETRGGMTQADSEVFLDNFLETFRWREQSVASQQVYEAMMAEHPLLADVVCFRNPHINHLTLHVADIDAVQTEMISEGLPAKEKIEGPPRRKCHVLLRQTAFRALKENIRFNATDGSTTEGTHTARFGEIEQRGGALTAKGMALYDQCLSAGNFADLPDDWDTLRREGLAWFRYARTAQALPQEFKATPASPEHIEKMLQAGLLIAEPIVYEDFLPVSAAGIFRSNLGQTAGTTAGQAGNKAIFEQALGGALHDPQALYLAEEERSLKAALRSDQDALNA
jgi:uncharacterized glyoxalase superfamily metalloenzyme YdcJ